MSQLPDLWTDIRGDGWLMRRLPRWAVPYAQLMRLDRPIGSWLLLLPCWWGVALAGAKIPNLWFMLLFAIGSVVMRGAGCIVNDLYDRDLDRLVTRTQTRPLASGEVQLWRAVVFLCLLLAIGLGVLLLFNHFTIGLGASSLLLVFTYPLMKRVTWWPQLVLGITFNWGILLGWSAVTGGVGFAALLMYIGGIFWTLGYDTVYAHQDIDDDETIGIKSTARLFGARSKMWVSGFYAAALFMLLLVGWSVGLGVSFYIVLSVLAAFTAIELFSWRPGEPQNCLLLFRANRDFGLIVLLAILLGKFL